MVSEIEKEQAAVKDDNDLEYFVDGERKVFIPYFHNLSSSEPNVMMLQAENMFSRVELKTGMARRIRELEDNEFWMRNEISVLKSKNETLENYIKKLEKKGCNCK